MSMRVAQGRLIPDEKTFLILKIDQGRQKGMILTERWIIGKALNSDKDAYFDRDVIYDAAAYPSCYMGTSPEDVEIN
ncbi:MAG: hypothetical protein CM15mP73_1410 [Hyphomicrobiales bacterium]|nr:MAG: hypothetical protein CM15mP73_1410 [Hyphomicrobiales bacterium]